MLKFVAKRILMLIPVLLGVTIIIFTMMYFTPGDPARLILGDTATQAEVDALRDEMGLNDSFLERYLDYLTGLLRGDLGTSYSTHLPVKNEIADRFPVTFKLAVGCMLFSALIGIPAGIISAIKQYSFLDNVVTIVALLGVTMPNFWLALMLILFFAVFLGILPASGFYGWKYTIMPIMSISAATLATVTRMTRSSMLDVIRSDYIRTARAKGLSEKTIIFKHALKNALIPIITVIGIQFASSLCGAVVNEQVFAIPGLGKMMVDAIKNRNYPVVQGGVFVIALIYSLCNLAVDIVYAYVDPRIKSQYVKTKSRIEQPEEDKQKAEA